MQITSSLPTPHPQVKISTCMDLRQSRPSRLKASRGALGFAVIPAQLFHLLVLWASMGIEPKEVCPPRKKSAQRSPPWQKARLEELARREAPAARGLRLLTDMAFSGGDQRRGGEGVAEPMRCRCLRLAGFMDFRVKKLRYVWHMRQGCHSWRAFAR